MAEKKVLVCDVCGQYGPSLDVELYSIRYPDGGHSRLHLCPSHADPLLKLREQVPIPQPATSAAPKQKRGGIRVID